MLILVESTQKDVMFLHTDDPFTIDKSAEWGEGNIQEFPDGGFVKASSQTQFSHGVQPREDTVFAPLGWIQGSEAGLYSKAPIAVNLATLLNEGDEVELHTKDGVMDYVVKEPSFYCYNVDADGVVDFSDVWVQSIRNLEKNYSFVYLG